MIFAVLLFLLNTIGVLLALGIALFVAGVYTWGVGFKHKDYKKARNISWGLGIGLVFIISMGFLENYVRAFTPHLLIPFYTFIIIWFISPFVVIMRRALKGAAQKASKKKQKAAGSTPSILDFVAGKR